MTTYKEIEEMCGDGIEAHLDNLVRGYYADLIHGAGFERPPIEDLQVTASLTLQALEEMLGIDNGGSLLSGVLREWLSTPAALRTPISFSEIAAMHEETMAEVDAMIAEDNANDKLE
jgi:hypothetical protein